MTFATIKHQFPLNFNPRVMHTPTTYEFRKQIYFCFICNPSRLLPSSWLFRGPHCTKNLIRRTEFYVPLRARNQKHPFKV